MGNDLTGKLGLDSTDFKTQIAALNREIKLMETGFRASASSLGDWANNASGLEMRIESLTGQMEAQQKKVAALRDEYEKIASSQGESSSGAQNMLVRINRETEALNKMGNELNQAKTKLDQMGDESNQAENNLEDLAKQEDKTTKSTSKLKDVMGGLGGALKAGAAGIAGLTVAVAGAAAGMAKSVIGSFGELEQSLGGSEAVFGEYAASIQKSGEDAYKNLGVSQSDYLATANKMGALFQGSGISQVKSLELTEKAMQRAADMASVMGIDMQTALDSVAGAAKGNFTMMDNLGVAMNATTVEAYALSKGLDFTWASASNAEKAEVAMQMFFENTEQYAGNFAKESSETITGSIGMLKAAYGSFMAGLGNEDADMSNLTNNLVDGIKTVVDNIVPVLKNIVGALPNVVGSLISAISGLLPILLETATTLFSQVLDTVVKLLPTLIPVAVDALMTIVNALIQNLPMLMNAGIQLLLALINGILPQLPLLIDTALKMIVTLAEGIAEAIPALLPMIAEIIPQIILTLIENLPLLIDAALQLIMALVDGLIVALPILIEYVPEIVQAIFDALIVALPLIGDAAVKIVLALVDGIAMMMPKIGEAAGKLIVVLGQGIGNLRSKILDVGKNIVTGVWQGIKDKQTWFRDQVFGFFSGIVGGVKKALGIQSPSKVFAGIGENLALGLGKGFAGAFGEIERNVNSAIAGLGSPTLSPVMAGSYGQGQSNQQPIQINITASAKTETDYYKLARRIASELQRR